MKKLNENGFSVVEVLVAVVVLCLLAGVGWLVYDRQKDSKKVENNSNNSSPEISGSEPEYYASSTYKTFENSIYTAKYPDNWNLKDPNFDIKGERPETQLYIASFDYKKYEGQSLVEAERGAEISIYYEDLKDGESLDNPKFNQKFDTDSKYSNRKTQTITVDGRQALQTEYEVNIEHSQYAIETIIYKNDKKLTIYYKGASSSSTTHRPAYDNLVQTFKLK